MNFKVIQPPQQLADYVRFFWFLEGNASIHKPFVHHAFAYPVPNLSFATKVNSNTTLSLKEKELYLLEFMDRRKPSARSLQKQISAFLDFIYILTLFHNYFAYQQTNSQISLRTLKRSAVKKVKSLKKK